MNKLKRFTTSLAALMLFSGVAMVAPASARVGSSGTTNDEATASSRNVALANETTTTQTSSGNTLVEQFREQAKEKLQAARQNVTLHTEAEREKACTARKTSLTKRMDNAVTQANRHKAVFDKIYTRVKDFYTEKKLNVTDYASLTANVDKAQANAQTSIAALDALNVNVDCTSQTVADSVSAFQQAVKNTRDSLKAYRAALVDLIKSLKGASTGANPTGNSTTNPTNQ